MHCSWWMPCHLAHTAYELLLDGWQRFFLLHCLIVFQNSQFQIDQAKHFKVTLNKCCIMWNTDICRTCLVWKYFKCHVTTYLTTEQQKAAELVLVSVKIFDKNGFWSLISSIKQRKCRSIEGRGFYKKEKVFKCLKANLRCYLLKHLKMLSWTFEGRFWEQKLVVPKKIH